MFFDRKGQAVLWGMVAALLVLGLGQVAGLLRRGVVPTQEQSIQGPSEQENLVVGTVIRQETVLYAPASGTWRCIFEEGQRAAAGQPLFTAGAAAVNTGQQTEQNDYARHLMLLEAIRAYQRPGSCGAELKDLLRADSDGDSERWAMGQSDEGKVIRAPTAGIFSRVTDGLEGVLTPDMPELQTADLPRKDSPQRLGKLITSDTWYFYAVLPEKRKTGETVEVRLLGGGFGTCRLTVERVKEGAEGYQTLLSAKTGLEAVTGVRRLRVKILSD